MLRARVAAYRDRVWTQLRKAFEEKHAPHEVAASFGLGTFITALPTLGTGLLLFPVFVYLSDRVSKLALLASVVVFNPVVKWGVYAASFWLGSELLGPISVDTVVRLTPAAGADVLARLLVGNAVLAVVLSVAGYAVVLKLVRAYRQQGIELVDVLPWGAGGRDA
ncbi:DUF2062 domain-containing protein [Halobacteriales archaeon QS_1_68_20]|nr:MAG: DUF2062 domain-containing protein [Halobacteriales archaeon QS_1_68_20]